MLDAEASAKRLHEEIYNPKSSIYRDYQDFRRPLCATIAFYDKGSRFLMSNEEGKTWLESNCSHINFVCLVGKFSWIYLVEKGWVFSEKKANYEETKRFIAVFLDNLRTLSELRIQYLSGGFTHRDWLSIYIRDQNLF